MKVVVLDAGPLGYAANPKHSPLGAACTRWVETHLASGNTIVIPEISDYEVRRELLRGRKMASVAQLDQLAQVLEYVPITTMAMQRAAELWAAARQHGQPTAGDKAIDGDAILAAQALTIKHGNVIVATTNVGHLARLVAADLWHNIQP
jgi:predicted nucleic acid-binding protein